MARAATLLRRSCLLVVVGSTVAVAPACGGSTAAYPEDERVSDARYYEEPDVYRSALLADPWVRDVRVAGSTFGRAIPEVVRIDIDGVGRLQDRDVRLQTRPAVALFSGETEQRMKSFLHGALTLVDERHGHLRGMAIADSRATFEAAAISPIIEQNLIDGVLSRAEKRYVAQELSRFGRERAGHALAWYDLRSSWITIGAPLGRTIRRWAVDPGSVTPGEGIFAAYVLRHELEHAVTTPDTDQLLHHRWIEEGAADVLATWPGAAAQTADALGLPYPPRYERRSYTSSGAGYPQWRACMRLLLRAAGVDHRSPKAFTAASRLLQSTGPDAVPQGLADAIAQEQGLTPPRRDRLVRQVEALRGDPRATRRLVRAWL